MILDEKTTAENFSDRSLVVAVAPQVSAHPESHLSDGPDTTRTHQYERPETSLA